MGGDPHGIGLITSLDQIGALSNPVRSRILRHAGRPVTVAELAERLSVPQTRLYYHVNLLVEEGLLAQVDERKSGARIEKIYLRTAATFQLGPGLFDEIGDQRKMAAAAAALLFDPAQADTEVVLERVFAGEKPVGEFGRTVVRLTEHDAERFGARIQALMTDLLAADTDEGPHVYSFTVAFIPTDTPRRGDTVRDHD